MKTQSWSRRCWKLGIVSSLALGGVSVTISSDCAFAQITPDGTLGANESSLIRTNVNINGLRGDRVDGGAQRGANLFHSFREFNIGENQRVYFTNPVGIENILSRVTGSNPSNILGTLGVLGSDANLFLMNPNGIIFGPNASLDVRGSFVATTANTVQLGDAGIFSASEPMTSNLLTVSPSALLFNAIAAQGIVNQSRAANSSGSLAGLQVPQDKTLALVGGDVALEGGHLRAPGGRIELGSVTTPGLVSLTPTTQGWVLGYENVQNF